MLRKDSIYGPLRSAFAEAQATVGGPETAAGRRLGLSAAFLEFVETEMLDLEQRWEDHKSTLL
jgi:hypothetical protein